MPKDTKALIQRARSLGVEMSLLEKVDEINAILNQMPPIDDSIREADETFNNNAKS